MTSCPSKASTNNTESSSFHSNIIRAFTAKFKLKASDHSQNQYKTMHDEFQNATQANNNSTNRTCQPSIGDNEKHLDTSYAKVQPPELIINSAAYITHGADNAAAGSLQHSLSVMPPPYRYPSSESSASFTLLPLSRRRWFQRQTCLLCIMVAFIFGLLLGVFVPMLDLRHVFLNMSSAQRAGPLIEHTSPDSSKSLDNKLAPSIAADLYWKPLPRDKPQRNHTPTATIGDLSVGPLSPFSVAFISDRHARVNAEEILSDNVHLSAQRRSSFTVHNIIDKPLGQPLGQYASKPSTAFDSAPAVVLTKQTLQRPTVQKKKHPLERRLLGIINSNIFWGEQVERALPKGFSAQDTRDWNAYVTSPAVVQRLEPGCGRMQNRMMVFSDGTRACARYRQNTDQIQGEIFSFYLGRLLNMSNLAPSAVVTVNGETEKWSNVVHDITEAQWQQQRPVVLTRWLPNLEPAGIPQPFQPLDRHLNKHDVWNITRALTSVKAATAPQPLVAESLVASGRDSYGSVNSVQAPSPPMSAFSDSSLDILVTPTSLALERLVELAQWSDLIVFDYLIANLDRVVNNLYNYQWNAEIMAAPAHNLARQSNSQLLIFLDNESGLLHGYRLLKKYEAYHGLLLNNLCVFREPTIQAMQQLRAAGAGRKLRELFEQTASEEVRDVLPALPDKSIKILSDRIDRVLEQVEKCKQLMDDR
ncbi:extracellular serine/threonine protein kinase four-jointed [Rhagoletis pomonella]|uniref:extracellular serine/threonine protein kinase four-jointed n=1 Tax=Rhagoletis pomonella TaxID=28610 RepID=UPI0017866C5D|nr:extracellular serine/threonine protein kinase four-jointed [Rhagoletis pomonella]